MANNRLDEPEPAKMTEKAVDLDQHRGMAAQKATDLRRLLAGVEANERALRLRQEELEAHLVAAPAANWPEAAEKARYLLNLLANSRRCSMTSSGLHGRSSSWSDPKGAVEAVSPSSAQFRAGLCG
jgi:hypothetical protein